MSVPTIFGAVNGKRSSIGEPEERPDPTEVRPTTKPPDAPDRHGDDLVAPLKQKRRVVGAAVQERLREKAETAEDERGADDLRHRRVGASPEAACDLHADERQRRRAEQHPEREVPVNGAEHAVPHGAERLEHGAVQDVGADGDLRVEPEDEDQDRRHQRAAAHPGHPDEDPDEQAGERELPGHRERRSRRITPGMPPSAPLQLRVARTPWAAARRQRASPAPSSR